MGQIQLNLCYTELFEIELIICIKMDSSGTKLHTYELFELELFD